MRKYTADKMSNKIGWCDDTWNPVWGCLRNCKYCYARNIAKRFASYISDQYDDYDDMGRNVAAFRNSLYNFEPVWFEDHYDNFNPPKRKPKKIFIGSMSDIEFWDEDWINRVIKKIKQYPQHTFQFLTKNPLIYDKYDFPDNCWLGWTIIKNIDFYKYTNKHGIEFNLSGKNDDNIFFASFEPLHGKIDKNIIEIFDWIIVGAETGNRKRKVIPKFEWLDEIYSACGEYNIPIYMKDNLTKVFPDLQLKKEFPIKKEEQ